MQKMTDASMVQVGIRCAVDAQSIEAASRESQCSRYLMHQGCKQGFTVQYMPDASRVQAGIHCEVDAQCIKGANRDFLCSRCLMHRECKQGFAVQ